MRATLCRKLAWENVKKNYRFFIPRMVSEAGLLTCFYIIFTLACDRRLASVKGGEYLPTFMWMGAAVIGLLSGILTLYTNSFLMKQRKREFGVYSVLGMEKRHICRVLFHESLLCSLLSITAGLFGGVLFYKLSSLAICKLLHAEIVLGFYFIKPSTLIPSGVIFGGMDLLAYLFNCISIRRMKTVELLTSRNTGEKEPKMKWVLLILGVLTLGSGYYISLTTESPLQAILLFFAAVLLVIAGTYLLFVAGSIFVLKMLKKKDRYYYRPGHMTAVSGLLYRMKQNAVGLASVAILATGVLIMISSTFCLYSRTEAVLKKNYPQDYYISERYDIDGKPAKYPENFIETTVSDCAAQHGLEIAESFSQKFLEVTFSHKKGELITDRESIAVETDLASLCNITFITEETYTALGGEPLGLKKDEVAVCPYNMNDHFDDTSFRLLGNMYHVAENLLFFPINNVLVSVNCYGMVVADEEVLTEIYNGQKEAYGNNASELQQRYCVSFADKRKVFEEGEAFAKDVRQTLEQFILSEKNESFTVRDYDTVWEARENLYGMYGTLLYLGILLGLVCLFATVLIIYYKQISEGYEDRQRYQIMQKIGMTEKEVNQTIRSQVMLVFFLPLVTAGIHVVFAYPIVTKLMKVLLLENEWLFAGWSLVVYIIFSLVYTLIYKVTAKTYYKIVY